MSLETDLGILIRMLNPYTNGAVDTMRIAPGVPAPDPGAIDGGVLAQLNLEVDNYEGHWAFTGQDQRITRALRIRYYHRAPDPAGAAGVFNAEYLLIGFVGAGGP